MRDAVNITLYILTWLLCGVVSARASFIVKQRHKAAGSYCGSHTVCEYGTIFWLGPIPLVFWIFVLVWSMLGIIHKGAMRIVEQPTREQRKEARTLAQQEVSTLSTPDEHADIVAELVEGTVLPPMSPPPYENTAVGM